MIHSIGPLFYPSPSIHCEPKIRTKSDIYSLHSIHSFMKHHHLVFVNTNIVGRTNNVLETEGSVNDILLLLCTLFSYHTDRSINVLETFLSITKFSSIKIVGIQWHAILSDEV